MNRDNSYLIGNQFAKGKTPWNKGRKGCAAWNKGIKGLHLSPATEFKPGMPPRVRYEIGALTVRRNKNRKLRRHVKTAGGWVEHAKWLWVQAFGPLIAGDVVHHLNGNALDDRVENLIAVPRADHPRIHSRWGIRGLTADQIKRYQDRYRVAQHGFSIEATS